MDARLNLHGNSIATQFLKFMNSAGKVVAGSTLPSATQELVKIRASQINGCAFCTDMHTKEAARAGETRCGSTWSRPGARPRSSPRPNAPRWSSRSRAPASPTPPVRHRRGLGERRQALRRGPARRPGVAIADINAYNRLNVITQQPAGDYQPGQWR